MNHDSRITGVRLTSANASLWLKSQPCAELLKGRERKRASRLESGVRIRSAQITSKLI